MSRLLTVCLAGLLLVPGCQSKKKTKPDYERPLPPGVSALRKITNPADWPDVKNGFQHRDHDLTTAINNSAKWFRRPSSKKHFPMRDVTYGRAEASLYAFQKILATSTTADQFDRTIKEFFDCYISIGYDDKGSVLYTGYYTPIFEASKTRTVRFRFPLYSRPGDLVSDKVTGKVYGRKVGTTFSPYPTRSEIEKGDLLKGKEVAWVASRLDQYIIHVNGSARLNLLDGSTMYLGYAGTNGREYTGLGSTLIKEGVLSSEEVSLPAIRAHFAKHPDRLEGYIAKNDRFVFFQEYDGANWPAGSLNVRVTRFRSLATDKSIFPRGGVVLVSTPLSSDPGRHFTQFMLDQDTGGAIRAAGRGDIYMGIGLDAEKKAGAQFAIGKLYYFFLKIERMPEWLRKMKADPRTPPAKPLQKVR